MRMVIVGMIPAIGSPIPGGGHGGVRLQLGDEDAHPGAFQKLVRLMELSAPYTAAVSQKKPEADSSVRQQ